MLCAFLCAYIHALFSCLDVSHTYFCNGLKVELNNEIPVSTSLRFCIPPDLVGCVYHAPHETDSDVSLLIYYKYNILIFSFSIYPIFMQMGWASNFHKSKPIFNSSGDDFSLERGENSKFATICFRCVGGTTIYRHKK